MAQQRGFTLIELAAVCVVGCAGAAAVLAGGGVPSARQRAAQPEKKPAPAPDPQKAQDPQDAAKDQNAATERERSLAPQMKDAIQVRMIDQALIVWATQNKDQFPLPSKFDLKQTTVPGTSAAKDTTANIFSILIYSGAISPETCVSPAEASESIKVCRTYQFAKPAGAAVPEEALWDPAFGADFTDGKTGNVSYAHLRPDAGRLSKWTSTFVTTEPVVGNRGPEIAKVEQNAERKLVARTVLEKSKTFLIHGEPYKWEGNIAYADAHVGFVTSLLPDVDPDSGKWATYLHQGKKVLDCYFYDEPDDVTHSNAFLGIFISSPGAIKGTRAIWD